MIENIGKLEWFGGNQDALNMYRMFIDMIHVWDDLIDKDKEVTQDDINRAFMIALAYLPSNPFFRSIQNDVIPMFVAMIHAYQTANNFEKSKDNHGIEIAHGLRYAAGHIIAYAVVVCVGNEKAKDILPELWKDIVNERFDDYRNEVIQNEK